MNREKSLIKFILTDRRFSLSDKIEYLLYRFTAVVYGAIFLFLVYEKSMHRVKAGWPGFLILLLSPIFLYAAWGRRIEERFIAPYREEKEG